MAERGWLKHFSSLCILGIFEPENRLPTCYIISTIPCMLPVCKSRSEHTATIWLTVSSGYTLGVSGGWGKGKGKAVPQQARCVPEGSRRFRLPDFMTFGTWRWWGCEPHASAAFTPRKCSWYSSSLGAGSTPGPWYCRKEYVTEKSIDTIGNRSPDHPTSSAAP